MQVQTLPGPPKRGILNPVPLADRDEYNAYMGEYMLARYHRRKADAKTRLGGRCAQCGRTDELEVDHIDWRTKAFPISKLWSVAETRFLEELAKCQLLCKEHHLEKTRQDLREIKRERGNSNQYGYYPPR